MDAHLKTRIVVSAGPHDLGVTFVQRPIADLSSLGSALVRGVLKELGHVKAVGAFTTTWLDETNPSALQAFLVGEQYYRLSAWDSVVSVA